MALTFTPSTIHPVDTYGAMPVRFVTAAPAATDYPAGGYTVTPGTGIAIGTIYFVEVVGTTSAAQATMVFGMWNTATAKLQFFWSGGGTSPIAAGAFPEVTAATDLSAFTFTLRITGINP